MILIKKAGVADAKPQTSLQEKTSGFKFQKPGANKSVAASMVQTPIEAVVEKPIATESVKSNGNGLLISKPQTKPQTTTQFKKPSDPIPEMADDKYEVVANAHPELVEEAGDKFKEQLGMLQSAIDGNGQLKDQMTNILTFLDDNPQYKDNVSPKDVAVFVSACRKIAGITVTEKTTRATTRKKASADVEQVLDDLADLSFDL